MAVPKNLPKAKVNVEEFITKDGKLDSNKFWKLSDAQIADLVGDAVHDLRTYIVQPTTAKKAASSVRLLEALDKENPDLGLGNYVTLFKSMESGDGSALTKSYFDGLKQYDPDTYNLYLGHSGWEAFSTPDFNFDAYKAENMPKDAESTPGVFTDKPASPAESAPGALTHPPAKLPEAGKQAVPSRVRVRDDEGNIIEFTPGEATGVEYNSAPPKIDKTIKEAEANAYTGNEPPIAGYNTPITSPGVHIKFTNAEGKPVDLTPEEISKFNPSTASPSPEAIGEAMRDAVKEGASKDSTVTVPPEAEAAAKKTEAKTPAAEAKTETATDKTDSKAPETAETPQGLFSRLGGHIGRNWGKYLGGAGLGTIGWAVLDDLASDDSTLKSLFRGNYPTSIPNTPSVTQPRNEPATNEEYVPGKIPSYIPQDNLPPIKELTNSKKVKNRPQQQEQQLQVVNVPVPENNATADYVRAAYNSYIPSDAGRAYQKAIYGDPLELDKMRLQQQQQQKWRDFVMRSGQSPAELVQRGLMPYDALQYV